MNLAVYSKRLKRVLWGGLAIAMTACAPSADKLVPKLDWRDAEFTSHRGTDFQFSDFHDRHVLLNFTFTGCRSYCPVQTHDLQRLYDKLERQFGDEAFQIISVSLTPEFDTPESLNAWADTFEAQRQSWIFADGELTNVMKIVEEFSHPVDRGKDPKYDLLHEPHVYLFDVGGALVGKFQGLPIDHAGIMKALESPPK